MKEITEDERQLLEGAEFLTIYPSARSNRKRKIQIVTALFALFASGVSFGYALKTSQK